MEDKEYEWVDLPSQGLCYPIDSPLRSGRIKMTYLTVMDIDNIIVKQVYTNSNIVETLIKDKIVDKNIDVSTMVIGDIEAILLWLRRTGYGDDMTVTIENEDGNLISCVVDLSKLEYNEFLLTADENGHFLYFMDNGDILNFKFLTYKDTKELEKADAEDLTLERLKLATVSINDNDNKDFIAQYIDRMTSTEVFLYEGFMDFNFPGIKNIVEANTIDEEGKYINNVITLNIDEGIIFNTK